MGDGSKFKLLEDVWLDNTQLKERYPRIHKNSMEEDKPIMSFGRWTTEVWEWVFSWRKAWFEWKKPMVDDLSFSELVCGIGGFGF